MDSLFFAFCLTVALFAFRNELIYRHYKRAIEITARNGLPLINVWAYDRILFDLTKWTFRQCFPELGDRK